MPLGDSQFQGRQGHAGRAGEGLRILGGCRPAVELPEWESLVGKLEVLRLGR